MLVIHALDYVSRDFEIGYNAGDRTINVTQSDQSHSESYHPLSQHHNIILEHLGSHVHCRLMHLGRVRLSSSGMENRKILFSISFDNVLSVNFISLVTSCFGLTSVITGFKPLPN